MNASRCVGAGPTSAAFGLLMGGVLAIVSFAGCDSGGRVANPSTPVESTLLERTITKSSTPSQMKGITAEAVTYALSCRIDGKRVALEDFAGTEYHPPISNAAFEVARLLAWTGTRDRLWVALSNNGIVFVRAYRVEGGTSRRLAVSSDLYAEILSRKLVSAEFADGVVQPVLSLRLDSIGGTEIQRFGPLDVEGDRVASRGDPLPSTNDNRR